MNREERRSVSFAVVKNHAAMPNSPTTLKTKITIRAGLTARSPGWLPRKRGRFFKTSERRVGGHQYQGRDCEIRQHSITWNNPLNQRRLY